MQPKTEIQFAVGVTEIVKTFISHPDHGLTPEDVPVMIKGIMQAFKEAVSGEAIAAALAQTNQTTSLTENAPVAAVEESATSTEVRAETAEAPAKKGREKKREASEAIATEAVTLDASTQKPAPEKAQSKQKETVDPLEAKFGERISRTPWNNMDPEAAIKHDVIVCLIDGSERKMLHRYIRTKFNMEAEEYRAWFGLRKDYPMTAPGYSKEKSDYAKVVGLGTKTKAEATKATPKTSRRTRKNAAEGASRQRTTA